MKTVTEIAADVYRISTYIAPVNLQFNQFLIKDDEPLLFHTGLKHQFPSVREAVESVLDPASLRWIAFSHYEADECGALNDWLALAPNSEPVCSLVAKLVSVDDSSTRRARGLADNEVLSTGSHRFRLLQTPHVPHCWEAALMFDEVTGTLFCSDIGHHNGDVEPVTETNIAESSRAAILGYQQTPMRDYLPYTHLTEPTLNRLADLQPKVLAIMHGSAYVGDGAQVLRDMAVVLRETLGPGAAA